MKKELIDIIREQSLHASKLENSFIEYNFELPEHEDIKKDMFFGVPAKLNPDMDKNKSNVVYKMG